MRRLPSLALAASTLVALVLACPAVPSLAGSAETATATTTTPNTLAFEDQTTDPTPVDQTSTEPATDPNSTSTAVLPAGGGPTCPYWTILTDTRDTSNRYVPTRCGDSTIAWEKACGAHNFCDYTLFNRTINGAGDLVDVSGTRYTYQGHVVGWLNGVYYDITTKVVTDRSFSTARGTTPDGHVVGTITAYCVGMTYCPNAVNTI
jgi:hypothetical protein